jgi:hypothetical protein
MRGHLPARDHGVMDPAPALYAIRIDGHLGATVLSAFPALAPRHRGAHTVLTGLLDRSALYGVLAQIEALGLDLPARGTPCSCSRPRSPGVRTIKTFGAPGPVARITVIRWRFLTCLAASLVVALPGRKRFSSGLTWMGEPAWVLPGGFQPKGDPP